jgi:shikimate kinase
MARASPIKVKARIHLALRQRTVISGPMRKLDRSVVLVGMMGSGKSAVGRRLATALGMAFRDADTEIEAAAGCSVNEIFARYGEPAFRDGERKVVLRLLEGPPLVLATGGGAFIDAETRARIKTKAISIWLKADLDLLTERVSRRQTRPLLNNGNPREVLEKLMRERAPIYSQADIMIESDDGPHETIVKRIMTALELRANKAS